MQPHIHITFRRSALTWPDVSLSLQPQALFFSPASYQTIHAVCHGKNDRVVQVKQRKKENERKRDREKDAPAVRKNNKTAFDWEGGQMDTGSLFVKRSRIKRGEKQITQLME